MRKKKAKPQPAPMELSYQQVEAATRGFSREMLVGHGSHGKVYRGVIQLEGGSGKVQVAVKKPSTSLGDRSKLKRELDVLTSVGSPQLVNLLGTAASSDGRKGMEGEEKLIVMEYMPNGSLHDLLHDSPKPPGWSRRLLVALQVAQGVQALHEAIPPIIHRDIKSSNVLLDSNWDAKLADFSLAVRDIGSCQQQYSTEESAASTTPPPPAGTIGYLDPCYSRPAKLGPKIDIFSYGVLMLELISGRRAMDMAQETTSILAWAAPLIKNGLFMELYDPRVQPPSFNTETAIKKVIGIASRCVSSREEERPLAEEIVRELRQAIEQLRLISPIWELLRMDRLAKRIYPYLGNWWIVRRQTRRITSTTIICTNHLYEDGDYEDNNPNHLTHSCLDLTHGCRECN